MMQTGRGLLPHHYAVKVEYLLRRTILLLRHNTIKNFQHVFCVIDLRIVSIFTAT